MQELIRMVSSAGTGFSYYTTKNKKNVPDKLVLKKYDPRVRRVVEFTEGKVHKGNK